MKIILNEQEILNNIINNKTINNKSPLFDLRILAKYYFGRGMNKVQVRDSLEDFMKKKYKGFNSVKWSKRLDELVKRIEKTNYELFVLDNIIIFQDELITISNVNNKNLEKVLFVLLVYAKIYNKLNKNNLNWVNCDSKYIYSDCKLAVSVEKQCLQLHNLKEMGFINISNMVDCINIKLNYAKEDGNIAIIISDFRDFVYEYLRWKGEKIGYCQNENCNRLIILKSNKTKYCNMCAKEIEKENHKERNKQWYKRKKCNSDEIENAL